MESKPKPRSLDDLIDPKRVSIEVKTLELAPEREARLRREEEDAAHDRARKKAGEDHERRKDFLLFVFSLAVVAVATLSSVVALFRSQTSPPGLPPSCP